MPLYTMERKNLLNFEHFKNKIMMDSFGSHWHKKNFKITNLNTINSKTMVEAIFIYKCDDDNLCKRQLLTTFTSINFTPSCKTMHMNPHRIDIWWTFHAYYAFLKTFLPTKRWVSSWTSLWYVVEVFVKTYRFKDMK